MLVADVATLNVKEWSDTQLVFEPGDGPCGSRQVVINLVAEKVTQVVTLKPNASDECKASKDLPSKFSLELKGGTYQRM
jgi:hypothetical protein